MAVLLLIVGCSESVELFDHRDGGIVIWIDPMDDTHGLVCAISDQGKAPWGCDGVEIDGTSTAIGTGEANTTAILAGCAEPDIAARLSADFETTVDGVLYDDWFLPSRDVLDLMYANRAAIDAAALANGGAAFSDKSYWSSSQDVLSSTHIAWSVNFNDGQVIGAFKPLELNVRSVRAF
ncbi:MAG: hypothetical protein ACR2MT_00690 [Aurantibacter sp.]